MLLTYDAKNKLYVPIGLCAAKFQGFLVFQMSDTTTEGVYSDIERSNASTTTTANVFAIYFIAFLKYYPLYMLILAKEKNRKFCVGTCIAAQVAERSVR